MSGISIKNLTSSKEWEYCPQCHCVTHRSALEEACISS